MTENQKILRPILNVNRLFSEGRFKIIRSFTCPYEKCGQSFYTNRQYSKHCDLVHICKSCYKIYTNINNHSCGQIGQGPNEAEEASQDLNIQSGKFQQSQSYYRGTILTFVHTFELPMESFADAFQFLYDDIENILKQCISKKKSIKASITIGATLIDMKAIKMKDFPFFSPFQRFMDSSFIMSLIMAAADYLTTSLSVFNQEESGMRLHKINYMEIRIAKYHPVRPKGYIPIPKEIYSAHFINVKCYDSLCFVYSVLAALKSDTIRIRKFPDLVYEQASKKQKQQFKRLYENPKSYYRILEQVWHSKEINFDGFMDGCQIEDISRFESQNRDISISVFSNEGKNLIPVRVTEKLKPHHIDLMLIKSAKLSNSDTIPNN